MPFGKRTSSPDGSDLGNHFNQAGVCIDVPAEEPGSDVRLQHGAAVVNGLLQKALMTDRGVHVESMLAILGAMAGFACLKQALSTPGAALYGGAENSIAILDTADGQQFYTGDLIDRPLLGDGNSVWHLVSEKARHLGASSLPDIFETATYVSGTYGTVEFGVPRLPRGHSISDWPVQYVLEMWTPLSETTEKFSFGPDEIPTLYAYAIQQVMQEARDVIDPGLAAQVVMECAVPMSRVDPKMLSGAQASTLTH